jgi:ActR/RegA family two-component response regulator/GGDEF domain-containing protein
LVERTQVADERASDRALYVVAIVDDEETARLMSRTLELAGDRLVISREVGEGLARAAAEAPDVVLVDVTLNDGAGLAVVHHVRAISPGTAVLALTREESLALGAQAVALGGTGIMMLPLSGDELLTALSDVRARRAEQKLRKELEHELAALRRAAELGAELVRVAEAPSRREAAQRLLPILAQAASARGGALYLPAAEGSRQLLRAAELGSYPDAPAFCEQMELLDYAKAHAMEVLPLTLRREETGFVLLDPIGRRFSTAPPPVVGLLAHQAATALALLGEREQSHRSAMKDPGSSAYTFAYFVDVAGREIDKARRHDRVFALATIVITDNGGPAVAPVEVADRVLASVRDTDVLARVEDNEFYLLMPETGGLGAHACRRRVLLELSMLEPPREAKTRPMSTMGVATYPHDGSDLSQLLRVARHRAEAAESSVVALEGLYPLRLVDMFGALAWSARSASASSSSLCYIEVPSVDLVALVVAVVREAIRGGHTRIVASSSTAMSVGAVVRSCLERDEENVVLDVVDVTESPECRELEVLTVVAQHGAYALIGRRDGDVIRAVHAADPLLSDLLTEKLGEIAGVRLLD